MAHVELIYDLDCPNIRHAREALLKAFGQARLSPAWTEWDRNSADSPPHVRRYGSPTILVDGRDVAGATPGNSESSCRLYRDGAGTFKGAPSVEQVAQALAASLSSSSGWRSSLVAAPGIAFAFLPKLACPACWPAYAGLLGAVGLGFLLDTAYLLPLTAAFLVLAVGVLALHARTRRGYGPFAVGLAAASVVLAGKFAFDSDAAMYGGLVVLVAASVWNAWPQRKGGVGSCPECVRQEPATETKNAP